MAVCIKPCRGCPLRHGCDLREEFRRRVLGLGLRSATFNCARLDAEVRAGRRIVIETPVIEMGSDYHGEEAVARVSRREVKATIVSVHPGGRFSCIVDEGEISAGDAEQMNNPALARFRRVRPHSWIKRFLDEPDGKFCSLGSLLRDGKCDRPPGESCGCRELAASAA